MNSPSFRVDEGTKKIIPLLLEGVPEGRGSESNSARRAG